MRSIALALPRRRTLAWSLPVALLLHLLVLLALASMPPSDEHALFPESSVDVELLTPQQFEAMVRPEPVEPPPPAPASAAATPKQDAAPAQAPEREPPAAPGTMVRASRLLSGQVLADPRSRQALQALPLLAEDERIEQLCAIEAMGQIHAWKKEFEPDRVTAYAMAETRFSGRTLLAEGAAFRSKRHWYNLRFKCEFTPDRKHVAGFEFSVGVPVPATQWAAHGLPAIH